MAVSGLLPSVGTFFVFSDYMRPAVRLAAIMQAKVAFVWTHDSVGVGEDGPTHQPIEQLASLRAMPGLRVIRPADANEVAAAWRVHLDGDGPDRDRSHPPEGPGARRHRRTRAARVWHAARTCSSTKRRDAPDLVLIGTGSEVSVCVAARERCSPARGHRGACRVDAVVGPVRGAARRLPRRGAAARSRRRSRSRPASSFGWERYADDVVEHRPLRCVGAGRGRAPRARITPEHVVDRALALLGVADRRTSTHERVPSSV